MTPDEIKAAETMKLRRYEERVEAANASVHAAKEKDERVAREGATRMDNAYFDHRFAAEEALAEAQAAAD